MIYNEAWRSLCTVWDDFFYEGPIDPDPDDDDGFVDGGVDEGEETCDDGEEVEQDGIE
jgi:hypothetical protein